MGDRGAFSVSLFFYAYFTMPFMEIPILKGEQLWILQKKVAKMRFIYHTNMLDICNVLNQLGILKDEKAEIVMKDHCMKSFDCMERMGLDVRGYFNKHKNETESYQDSFFCSFLAREKNIPFYEERG